MGLESRLAVRYSRSMNYEEAAESEVSPRDARREILRHGASWDEFIAEVGNKQIYLGSEVLDWLGY